MDELKKKRNIRGGHRAFATQLIRQIEDSLEDQLKLKQLEIQLDEKFEVLGKLDDEILGLVSEIDEDGLGCSQEISEAGEMKEKINLALLKLKSLVKNEKQLESQKPNLTRHGSEESVYSVESSASSATRKVRAKLPKLELKKFSGRPQDWQEFWDSYKSAVYENEEISKIDKFSYLKHYLEEPAKKVIAGLALTEKNYDVAVDLLEQRFARPTTIKRAHINELLNLDAVFNEKHVKKMRELYDTIETHHRGLKALGVDETSYSNIVVPVLMDKVPEAVRLNMIRGSKNHQEWDMEEMLVAFREELEIREQHVSISMALGNGTVSGRTSSERRSIKTFGSQNMDEKIRDVVELELKGVESGGKVKIQAFVVNEVSEIRNEHVEILKLKGQLKKLKEKPAIMETYDGIIKQQERDRIIEEVTSLEPSEKLSYLPHHAVVRNDAETTKDL
eukprot:gene8683-biopygen9689